MARIVKLAVVDSYPSNAVAKKIAASVLDGAEQALITRADVRDILKSDVLAKAPKTAEFLAAQKKEAKSKGAWYILVKNAPVEGEVSAE